MNIKFFETKEQYLAFRAAWRAAVNDVRAKPHFTEEAARVSGRETSIVMAKVRHDGWLHATHHILFNIARGKEPNYGFTPITNQNKLDNGSAPWLGYNQALLSLKWILRQAVNATESYESYIEKRAGWLMRGKNEEELRTAYAEHIKLQRRDVDKFLELFNGAFTFEDLLRIELPEPIYDQSTC